MGIDDDILKEFFDRKKFDGMDERAKARYERIENQVADEGYKNEKIHDKSTTGYGDFDSFFDILVDCKLAGEDYPNAKQVFENMKKQMNSVRGDIAYASEEYRKLSNECRHLRREKEELIKGE